MSKYAARLLELFQGRTSEFALGRKEEENGKAKVAYMPSRRPLELADLEAHMDGTGPVVGVYVLREDSQCKFAAFDIDNQDLLAAEKLRQVATELGFPQAATMLVDSGNKGYHLHLFFEDWIPGTQARRLMQAILRLAGMHERKGPYDKDGVEVFPKQGELGPHSAYGNLIKLPLVIHPVSGRRADIIRPSRVIPAPVSTVTAILEALEAPGSPHPLPPTSPASLPDSPAPEASLPVLASPPGPETAMVVEGARNQTLTSWAGKLRRDGLGQRQIETMLEDLNQKLCSPPLSDKEIRSIARSISRYPAGEGDLALRPPGSYKDRANAQATESTQSPGTGEIKGVEIRGAAKVYRWGAYEGEEGRSIQWLIEQWLIQGQLHLTVGQEKLGKSTQAWHRVESITRGIPYLGLPARKGRVLVMSEMSPDTIETLLEEDDILVDGDYLDVMFLDEYDPRGRVKALVDAITGQDYIYCLLDPLDECLGFDADGVWNPSTVSAGIDQLRDLMRGELAIEGLFHYNKGGKVANSYKFTSKPDHIYELKGDVPSDLTIKYRGRTRAIPRVRRLTGNGNDGYELTLLEQMPVGRPSKTQQMIAAWMRDKPIGAGPAEISRALELPYEATQQALRRMVKAGTAVRLEHAIYTLTLSSYSYSKHNDERGSTKEVPGDTSLPRVGRWPKDHDGHHDASNDGTDGTFVRISPDPVGEIAPDACPTCHKTDYKPLRQGHLTFRQCLACGQTWLPDASGTVVEELAIA